VVAAVVVLSLLPLLLRQLRLLVGAADRHRRPTIAARRRRAEIKGICTTEKVRARLRIAVPAGDSGSSIVVVAPILGCARDDDAGGGGAGARDDGGCGPGAAPHYMYMYCACGQSISL
jgi:hypothetical protein